MKHDPEVIAALDRCLRHLRRLTLRPPLTSVPVTALGRSIDFSKVLACLAVAEHPEGHPTVAEVANALNIEHSTTSRLVSESATEGLVTRSADPADRRRTIVTLTEAGEAVVAESTAVRTFALDLMFGDWDAGDLGNLTELLERLVDTCCLRFEEVLAALPTRFPTQPASEDPRTASDPD